MEEERSDVEEGSRQPCDSVKNAAWEDSEANCVEANHGAMNHWPIRRQSMKLMKRSLREEDGALRSCDVEEEGYDCDGT
jgi:hypothetical protein